MVRPKKLLLSGLAAVTVLFTAPAGQAMVLASSDFPNGGRLTTTQVNSRCGGENRSPALSWSGAPTGTQSFALTLFDPDARGGRGFWHWIVFNVPANTLSLAEGAGSGSGLPRGTVQADNDFGATGFGGACPPPGAPHHYQFTLFALDAAKAPFGPEAKPAQAATWFQAHTLATATLVAIFQR